MTMPYREKAEMTSLDEIEEETRATPSPDNEPENPLIWVGVIMLAIEATIVFWLNMNQYAIVVSLAMNVVAFSLFRIEKILTLRAERKNQDALYMGYICKTLYGANEEVPSDKRKGLPLLIHEHNRNKLTYPQAMEVAAKVTQWRNRAD
jgi:hypothetical protein